MILDSHGQILSGIGYMLKDAQPGTTTFKDHTTRDVITEDDLMVQKNLIKAVHDQYGADILILAEEAGQSQVTKEMFDAAKICAVIDPLDGTGNWSRGSRMSVIGMGIFRYGKPEEAYLFDLEQGILWVAVSGKGVYKFTHPGDHSMAAFKRRQTPSTLEELLVLTDCNRGEGVDPETFSRLVDHFKSLRIHGSALHDWLLVATEHFVMTYNALYPWDNVGLLFAEEMGMQVCERTNPMRPFHIFDRNPIVAPPQFFEEFFEICTGTPFPRHREL